MSDGEWFYLVFVLIYLSECVLWAGRRSVPFAGPFLKWLRPQRASAAVGTARAGAVMLNPFPPLGSVHLSEFFPLSLTPEGVSTQLRDAPNPGPHPLRSRWRRSWAEIEKVGTEGRRIFIDGEPVVDLCSSFEAEAVAALLRALRDEADPERRQRMIDGSLDRTLNARHVRQRRRWFRAASMRLRVDCIGLWLIGFLVIPYAYWRYKSELPFLWTLLITWLLMIKISLEFFLLHRRLYPRQRGERWQFMILSLFVPQFAMRAIDAASKPLLARFHPLAIVRAVTRGAESHDFIARAWRDLRHPLSLPDPDDEIAVAFHQRSLVPAVERFCRREGLEVGDFEQPPPAEEVEEGCERYCPRCRVQYAASVTVCADCGEVALAPMG